jgi:hypothetical protein
MAANAVCVQAAAGRVSGKGRARRHSGMRVGVARRVVAMASSKQQQQRGEGERRGAAKVGALAAVAAAAVVPTDPAFAAAQEMAQVRRL